MINGWKEMSFFTQVDADYRLRNLNQQLARLGGESLDWNKMDPKMARSLWEANEATILKLRESGATVNTPEYAKALLLRESVKIILKEIMPKRSLLNVKR
jgi:hypothetical protein